MKGPASTLAALALGLAGCASTPGETASIATSTSTTHVDPTAPVDGQPDYEVHEWGLLDVEGTNTHAHALPNPYVEPRPVNVKKPVLYFHLAKGTERAVVDVKVSVPKTSGGAIVEHYPEAELSDGGATITWSGVVLTKGNCTTSPPSKDSPACQTADRVCESLDLGQYVAADASCAEVPAGSRVNHLFYRAHETTPTLPFDVAEEGARIRITHARGDDVIGPIVWVHDATGATTVSVLSPPALGNSLVADAPTTSDASSASRAIDGAMREAGLTEEERGAFDRAWRNSLYGADTAAKKEPVGASKAAPAPNDYLLFVVPASLADGVSTLTFTPPPRAVRRFLLVRLSI